MNPYLILAIVLAFVGNGFYWNHHGSVAATTELAAVWEKDRADREVKARDTERVWQGAVNETQQKHVARVAEIQRTLDIALNSLRDRPNRPSAMPSNPRVECAGSSGAELSRTDAEFLAREAARADSCRAGLDACYTVIDKVR